MGYGAYLAGLAVSTEALIYITDAGPNEMQWLTPLTRSNQECQEQW
jgi:hypothetical protein